MPHNAYDFELIRNFNSNDSAENKDNFLGVQKFWSVIDEKGFT